MKLIKRSVELAIVTFLFAHPAQPWPGLALDLDRLAGEASRLILPAGSV